LSKKCDHGDILVIIPPVFDESYIRARLGGRCTHTGDDTITISRL